LARRQTDAVRRLRSAIQRRLEQRQSRLQGLARSLSAISPLATVARGYSILQHEDGRVVRVVADAAPGDVLDARVSDGHIKVRVT
ncbi:MAG: exodeoxyribonuclease VII large subunit, partial [Pseudomonadota bacterium]|nr:exodeoxyribonuclease VII large subunit [Pseudomonadota bacterium]